ncbi:hypothetical protein U3516DRAFT_749074 [Neocallimastix sp. 'constans']
MAVLLSYNKVDSYTLSELQEQTGLTKEALLGQLNILCKAKTYVYNPNFKFKKIRVPLNKTIRSEQKSENEETREAIENDRFFNTIISQLKNRFKPRVADIKKNIDILLNNEYIERKEGEKDTYNYLA